MISDTIEFVRKETIANFRDFGMEVADGDVIAGNVHMLKEQNSQRGDYITLVNIEEEKTLKNLSHNIRKNNKPHKQEPPVHLNLFILFSFNSINYNTSLTHLSKTIELFQSKKVFNSKNASAASNFPANVEKLIFDMHSLDLEKLNHLWGILGGAYLPSVLYKVRMIAIQSKAISEERPEITTVKVETGMV